VRAKDAVGQYGERVAAEFLAQAGLQIIERNWRCREGELDIIAVDGDVLVFCEVKTRSSTAFGDPSEAVGPAKAARIRRLAVLWLEHSRTEGRGEFWPHLRFDVISVLRPRAGAAQVSHLQAAF
jgi:putative endonuclease